MVNKFLVINLLCKSQRYRKLILSLFGLFGKIDRQEVPEETTKKLKALDHEVAETITFAPEKVFKGRLVNRIECQECRSVKTFEESFLDLSLPIVPDKVSFSLIYYFSFA